MSCIRSTTKHDPYIAVSHCGGAMLTFNLTAVDLWTAILTTMALVRHCRYVPTAVEAAAAAGLFHPF
jgi:hypothetical protein